MYFLTGLKVILKLQEALFYSVVLGHRKEMTVK